MTADVKSNLMPSILIYDAEPEMRDPGRLGYSRALQFNVLWVHLVEYPDSVAEQHRGEVDL
jgi:hypothetical protein